MITCLFAYEAPGQIDIIIIITIVCRIFFVMILYYEKYGKHQLIFFMTLLCLHIPSRKLYKFLIGPEYNLYYYYSAVIFNLLYYVGLDAIQYIVPSSNVKGGRGWI